MSILTVISAVLWASLVLSPLSRTGQDQAPTNTIPADQIEVQLPAGMPSSTKDDAATQNARLSDMLWRVLEEARNCGAPGLQRFAAANGIPFANERLPVKITADSSISILKVEKVVTSKGGKVRSIFEENVYAEVSIKALRVLAKDKRINRVDLDMPIYQPMTSAPPQGKPKTQ